MKNLYLTTAITLLASPTLADITPEELWQSWQELGAEMGVTLTASQQERQGDVLVLQGVTSTIAFSFFNMEQTLETIRLEAMDDGAVAVNFDTVLSGQGGVTLPDMPATNTTLLGQISGTSGVVTGTPDDYIYDFTIDELQASGDTGLAVQSGIQSTANMKIVHQNLQGQLHYTKSAAGIGIDYSFTLDSAESTQDSVGQRGDSAPYLKQSQRTQITGYSGEMGFFLPMANPNADQGRLLRVGTTLDANIEIQHIALTQKTTSPAFNMDMEMAQGPSTFAVVLSPESLRVSGEGGALEIAVNSAMFGPQPFNVELAKSAGTLEVPLYPSDSPQDARYAISLEGVTAGDSIWAMFDPANTLSRAPADFAFDARASIGLLLDWTHFETLENWQGEPPALLHEVALQNFLVSFENAKVSGEGAVTFSNEGSEPTPNGGALNFTLEGLPSLLEKLGGLPMVDPSLMAGAQGMLGIFTTAGDSSDSRTSRIEFTEDGHILVNGQQVQ